MSSTPFGEHLRREREMRGVSLDEISAATRISTRFLEALEHEQWEHLPGGAFNRGFIRSIARFLGIDEDALVAEYAFERKDGEFAAAPATPLQQIPRNWRSVAAAVVVLILVIAGGLLAYRRYGAAIGARVRARFAHHAAGSSVPAVNSPASTAGGPAKPSPPASEASH